MGGLVPSTPIQGVGLDCLSASAGSQAASVGLGFQVLPQFGTSGGLPVTFALTKKVGWYAGATAVTQVFNMSLPFSLESKG